MSDNIKKVSLAELEPVIREKLNNGGTVQIPITGTSMLPLLVQGRDSVILSPAEKVFVGDIIFYKRDDGHFVLHRVIDIKNDEYILCGDNQWKKEYGITDKHIIGVVTEIIRDGKNIKTDDADYIKYCKRWAKTMPIRKPLVKISSKFRAIKRKMSSR